MTKPNASILNVPNVLTLFRIACVGFLIWAFARGLMFLALAFYLVAGATDLIDGYLARKHNQVTTFGKLMDPLADKLMMITALVCLYIRGNISLPILIIVSGKEAVMVVGAALLLTRKDRVVFANKFGKFAAGFFFCALVSTFFHDALKPVDSILLYAATLTTVAAMVQYGVLNVIRPALAQRREAQGVRTAAKSALETTPKA